MEKDHLNYSRSEEESHFKAVAEELQALAKSKRDKEIFVKISGAVKILLKAVKNSAEHVAISLQIVKYLITST